MPLYSTTEALFPNEGLEYLKTKTVHPMVYGLIVNKIASYYDVMHNYSIFDIIDLCEILIVKQENEAMYRESLKKKGG